MTMSKNNQKPSNATVDLFQDWINASIQEDFKSEPLKNNNSQTLSFENVRIDFPLRPYPAQVQMMKKIIHTLNESENALLESPTGSGKSLALLCSVLAWRENEETKVATQIKMDDKLKKETIEESDIIQNIPTTTVETHIMNETTKKKETSEFDPSNWRKKFTCSENEIIIDEDSFEDFQPKAFDSKDKTEAKYEMKSEMDQVNSMKYKTFQKVPRIFVGSRTHKQITQLISELKTKTRYNPRTTVLGSRDQLCIHPKVSKMANKSEACSDLLDKSACGYAHRAHNIITHPSLKNTNRVWDIEDLVTLGKKVKGCPYYASRKIFEGAEVIFCPYNYIIDPVIRKILDINLKGSIIILDEAHNIEDSSRSAGSFEVDEQKLGILQKELEQVIRNGHECESHQNIEAMINYLHDWICEDDNVYTIQEYEAHHCHWTGASIINKLADGSITSITFHEVMKPSYKKIAAHAEQVRKDKENSPKEEPYDGESSQPQFRFRKSLSDNSLTLLQGIFMVFGFLFREDKNFKDDYQMVLTKRIQRGQKATPVVKRRKKTISGFFEADWSFKLAFKCLNPGIIFTDMTETTRSVILTSGTLSPLNTFASELETKFEGRLEANHVIDKSQVWVGGIAQGPNRVSLRGVYTNWESFQYQDELGESLCQIVENVPFGVLCFLPSYNNLDKLLQRWKLTNLYDRLAERKMIFCEPRGSDKLEFEKTIGSFYRQVDTVAHGPDNEGRDGALFFAVFRGKVSEGIDFTDNYCRAVVTIGIPFPAVKDIEVMFKKEYNDKKRIRTRDVNLLTSNQWYTAQAFRAINQALGRCIRHRNDWGAIILLEDRFSNSENVNQLSKWVRNQFKMHQNFSSAIGDLNAFVQRQLERTAINEDDSTSLENESDVIMETKVLAILEQTSLDLIKPADTPLEAIASPIPESKSISLEKYADESLNKQSEIITVPFSDTNANVPSSLKTDSKQYNSKTTSINSNHSKTMVSSPTSALTMSSYFLDIKTESSSDLKNINPLCSEPKIVEMNAVESISEYPEVCNVTKNDTSFTQPSVIKALEKSPSNIPSNSSVFYSPPQIPLIDNFLEENNNTISIPFSTAFQHSIPTISNSSPIVSVEKAIPNVAVQPISEPDVFKVPLSPTKNLSRKDLFSISSDDHSQVQITCACCERLLLEGPTRTILPVTIKDLSLITNNLTMDNSNMVEISEPGRWETNVDFVGGPIDVRKWPNESTVIFNSNDGICYRSLHCLCPVSKSQGLVIRQSVGFKNSKYDGKVFLWLTQVSIKKKILKDGQSNVNYQPDDFMEIQSSQIPSMNDMFYDL